VPDLGFSVAGAVKTSTDAAATEREAATACGCGAPCDPAEPTETQRVLPIVWQRLVTDGETCPRVAARGLKSSTR
jgi:hypothetical protein